MQQLFTVQNTTKSIRDLQSKGLSIGFVPTMGALHEGHLRLITRSCKENDYTACSIFVNPLQFNNKQDLEKYPRDLEHDIALLEQAGCDILFSPAVDEMYPPGGKPGLVIDLGMLGKVMEGMFRPGHFDGVVTVVEKLFRIIGPDRAYFGKKDYQQLAVVRRLVESSKIPVTIVACETVREPDGLAMSSRNVRLTESQRSDAPRIYQVLCAVRDNFGRMPIGQVKQWAVRELSKIPSARVEYFEIADRETFIPITTDADRDRAVALTAVYMGDVRLIDNLELFS
ncbi:MAG TPA: pantoate--beta-alanine ligase [Bacteroidales bacterium]|nr:pantoate--beta-alanine ligase [Bacteroidales bacterium]